MTVSAEIESMERDLRQVGKSAKAFCADAGVNQSTWGRWKRGVVTPNMATWAKVREAFGRTVAPEIRKAS